MNIIIGGPYPYRENNAWGGVESVISNLNIGISNIQSEFKIQILTNSKKATKKIEKWKNVTYIKSPKFYFGSIFISHYPILLRNFLRKNQYSLINPHSIDIGYYSLKNNKPIIFTLHGMPWEEIKYVEKNKQRGWKFFYIDKINKILKQIDSFISINPYAKEMVKNKTDAEIFEINNPVIPDYFKIKDKYSPKNPFIFYIGVISPRKNLFNLIKAMKIVNQTYPEFGLKIAGRVTDQKYYQKIMCYIEDNKKKLNIQFLGEISDNDKKDYYSRMHSLILPSFQETAPMVISESFAAGKPVITSNCCGMPHMMNDESNGFLMDPDDIENISEKIIQLYCNPNEYIKKKSCVRNYALENHSVEIVAKKYITAYQKILY